MLLAIYEERQMILIIKITAQHGFAQRLCTAATE